MTFLGIYVRFLGCIYSVYSLFVSYTFVFSRWILWLCPILQHISSSWFTPTLHQGSWLWLMPFNSEGYSALQGIPLQSSSKWPTCRSWAMWTMQLARYVPCLLNSMYQCPQCWCAFQIFSVSLFMKSLSRFMALAHNSIATQEPCCRKPSIFGYSNWWRLHWRPLNFLNPYISL